MISDINIRVQICPLWLCIVIFVWMFVVETIVV